MGSGGSLGGEAATMEKMRSNLAPVLARKANLKVAEKVPSNHSEIVARESPAIAEAVRDLASR